jgi:hypothetical protein
MSWSFVGSVVTDSAALDKKFDRGSIDSALFG